MLAHYPPDEADLKVVIMHGVYVTVSMRSFVFSEVSVYVDLKVRTEGVATALCMTMRGGRTDSRIRH